MSNLIQEFPQESIVRISIAGGVAPVQTQTLFTNVPEMTYNIVAGPPSYIQCVNAQGLFRDVYRWSVNHCNGYLQTGFYVFDADMGTWRICTIRYVNPTTVDLLLWDFAGVGPIDWGTSTFIAHFRWW